MSRGCCSSRARPASARPACSPRRGRIAGERSVRVLTARGSQLEKAFGFGAVRQLFEPELGARRAPGRAAGRSGGQRPHRVRPRARRVGRGLLRRPARAVLAGGQPQRRRPARAGRRRPPVVRQRLAALARLPGPPAGRRPGARRRHRAHRRAARRRGAAHRAVARARRRRGPPGRALARGDRRPGGAPAGRAGLAAVRRRLPPHHVGQPAAAPAAAARAGGRRRAARRRARRRRRRGRVAGRLEHGAHAAAPAARPAPDVARAAAVLGDGAALPVVAALAGLSEAETAAGLAALARCEIVKDEQPMAFVHPLVRDAVYRDLPAAERALRHERAAALLRTAGASRRAGRRPPAAGPQPRRPGHGRGAAPGGAHGGRPRRLRQRGHAPAPGPGGAAGGASCAATSSPSSA